MHIEGAAETILTKYSPDCILRKFLLHETLHTYGAHCEMFDNSYFASASSMSLICIESRFKGPSRFNRIVGVLDHLKDYLRLISKNQTWNLRDFDSNRSCQR